MAHVTDGNQTSVTKPSDTEIVIERTLDATPELVWAAWSNTKHLSRWWGPDGFTTTTEAHEFRAGGQWRYVMHGPDGTDYPNLITYIEIDEPNRIVYKHGGEVDCEPVNFVTEASFTRMGGQTRVTLHMSFPTRKARDMVLREYGAAEGGKQTLAKLDAYVQRMDGPIPEHEPMVFSRVFDAPRSLVWEAWTREEHLAKWFGPKQVTLSHCSLDLRVGGMMLYCMVGLGCEAHWGRWIFREISEPDRLVFVVSFADAQGNAVRAFFDEQWPLEMLTTVTFSEHAGKGRGTLVTMESEPINATDEERAVSYAGRESMRGGWGGTFDKLSAFLTDRRSEPFETIQERIMQRQEYKHIVSFPSDREIRFSREFDGSIEQVWDAFTRPELIKKWMIGPGGWSMSVCSVEARVGGAYRYEWVSDDGSQAMGMGGEFLAFDPPKLIKSTQVFDEDWTDGEAVGTLTLTEHHGKTLMENTVLYKTKATRDAVLKTPMEQGMAAGFERIDAMLAGTR